MKKKSDNQKQSNYIDQTSLSAQVEPGNNINQPSTQSTQPSQVSHTKNYKKFVKPGLIILAVIIFFLSVYLVFVGKKTDITRMKQVSDSKKIYDSSGSLLEQKQEDNQDDYKILPRADSLETEILPNGKVLFIEEGGILYSSLNLRDKKLIVEGKGIKLVRFSPDGDMFAYIDSSFILWLYSLKSDEKTKVTDIPVYAGLLTWSPDSSKIAFSQAIPDAQGPTSYTENDLYIYSLSNGKVNRILSSNPGGVYSSIYYEWSSDSKILAYSTINQIGVVDSSYNKSVVLNFEFRHTGSGISYVPQIFWKSTDVLGFLLREQVEDASNYTDAEYEYKIGNSAKLVKSGINSISFLALDETRRLATFKKPDYVRDGDVVGLFDKNGVYLLEGNKEPQFLTDRLGYLSKIEGESNKVIISDISAHGTERFLADIFDVNDRSLTPLPIYPEFGFDMNQKAYTTRESIYSKSQKQYFTRYVLVYNDFGSEAELFMVPSPSFNLNGFDVHFQ